MGKSRRQGVSPRMNSSLNKWSRRLHRWGALLISLPVLLVIGTGILLQVKKQVPWVQPPTQPGNTTELVLTFDQILERARHVPEADITGWADVDRLDVRPAKGMVKVRAINRWEIQLDAKTGEVLQVAYRRSDLIESLHDGSFFHDQAKMWVFLPNGLILFGLWLTGLYLFFLPHYVVRRRRRRMREEESAR